MRRRLMLNAQIKIAYHWKKYVKDKAQKKIRERLEAEQKRKADRDKKTGKGSAILVQTVKYKESTGLGNVKKEEVGLLR